MKHLIQILAVLTAVSLISCNTAREEHENTGTSGLVVLNNGNWGSNDACITAFSPETQQTSPELFLTANGQHLGDLGQDMLVFGEELYIAVNGSKVIFITDFDFHIKSRVEASADGNKLSPRCFAAAAGKVYVSYYEGYVGEIDPRSHEVRITEVGPNPDGITSAGGKLYVANSGGYLPEFNNTLSVVDISSFKETATITVNTNPSAVVADETGAFVYVLSYGDYGDTAPALEVVDLRDRSVHRTDYQDVKGIALGKDNQLIVATGSYDAQGRIAASLWIHDAGADKPAGRFSAGTVSPFYSLSADTRTGLVSVGTSDYVSNGDVHVFNSDGEEEFCFDSEGLNPIKVIFWPE